MYVCCVFIYSGFEVYFFFLLVLNEAECISFFFFWGGRNKKENRPNRQSPNNYYNKSLLFFPLSSSLTYYYYYYFSSLYTPMNRFVPARCCPPLLPPQETHNIAFDSFRRPYLPQCVPDPLFNNATEPVYNNTNTNFHTTRRGL